MANSEDAGCPDDNAALEVRDGGDLERGSRRSSHSTETLSADSDSLQALPRAGPQPPEEPQPLPRPNDPVVYTLRVTSSLAGVLMSDTLLCIGVSLYNLLSTVLLKRSETLMVGFSASILCLASIRGLLTLLLICGGRGPNAAPSAANMVIFAVLMMLMAIWILLTFAFELHRWAHGLAEIEICGLLLLLYVVGALLHAQVVLAVSAVETARRSAEVQRMAAPELIRYTPDAPAGRHLKSSACAICLEDFQPSAWVAALKCGHAFHEQCIHNWMSLGHACPLRCMDQSLQHQHAWTNPRLIA